MLPEAVLALDNALHLSNATAAVVAEQPPDLEAGPPAAVVLHLHSPRGVEQALVNEANETVTRSGVANGTHAPREATRRGDVARRPVSSADVQVTLRR